MSASMSLAELLTDIAVGSLVPDVAVTGLHLDSRRVGPGDAFVALPGAQTHGIAFARTAFAQGASVILAEPADHHVRGEADADLPGPVIWLNQLRQQLGTLAARFHGHPSADMTVVGVTGTNGKTSTVQMLAVVLQQLGHCSASIGTLGAGLTGHLVRGEHTTPDVLQVHAKLAELRAAGASHVAMEVSSHALDQGRVDAVAFDVAVFTNLTRDHLDYHGSMQAYAEAKARLFAWPTLAATVLNIDDAFGVDLSERVAANVACWTFSTARQDAAVYASDVRVQPAALSFTLNTSQDRTTIESPLLGRFNVANLVAVAASLQALQQSFADVANALPQLASVPGRMRRLGGVNGQPLLVVDYAHTPDALEQALAGLREHCRGRLICVFGCGGERDAGKRPQMGASAERLADRIIITDDNPRNEDGAAIVRDILDGVHNAGAIEVERDRAQAIGHALATAALDDVILVAGKGHETTQEQAGETRPFDDLAVARAIMGGEAC